MLFESESRTEFAQAFQHEERNSWWKLNWEGGRRLITGVANYPRTNQPQPESTPLWFWLINQLFSGAKSALQFLWEQPGQLEHIEWPSVHTVVRMAILTLIVVTCLIVLLATIDSTMSYVLASVLRRVP